MLTKLKLAWHPLLKMYPFETSTVSWVEILAPGVFEMLSEKQQQKKVVAFDSVHRQNW